MEYYQCPQGAWNTMKYKGISHTNKLNQCLQGPWIPWNTVEYHIKIRIRASMIPKCAVMSLTYVFLQRLECTGIARTIMEYNGKVKDYTTNYSRRNAFQSHNAGTSWGVFKNRIRAPSDGNVLLKVAAKGVLTTGHTYIHTYVFLYQVTRPEV